ncbi:DUF4232 domain-containing protein [Streptomyces sp. ID05-04B]|uniref:DUF4232 domain-containing protein n=1 Tax=unclassified Streptomyces TaxID=2593676 RepID=UPI000D1B1C91|nr:MULTISPECIES: DUF4232 domain-containing protein [unclassified Streptomyces]AVV44615.1 DUF4232 domain-containing protein [Streptomyces sp. P3]MDX5564173.1 DUF4232 domain-containing protein [Streptomyces sp. ID05-04B]
MNVKSFGGRRVAVAAGLALALGCGVSVQASATGPRAAGGKAEDTVAHGSGGTGGKGAVAACSQDVLGVSAVKEPADSKEARHLLLIVQNAGDKKCNLYRHPLVRLGADARTTVPVIKESDPNPGAPVTLAPGEEAYAALLVSGGARDEYEARSITLGLQGRKPGSTAGRPIDVPMPAPTLYADDGQLVTYWTTASGYALDFIMSK